MHPPNPISNRESIINHRNLYHLNSAEVTVMHNSGEKYQSFCKDLQIRNFRFSNNQLPIR